jgi:hypothetical protein
VRDSAKYAMSIDDKAPRTVNITTADNANDTTTNKDRERNVVVRQQLVTSTGVLNGFRRTGDGTTHGRYSSPRSRRGPETARRIRP